MNFKLKESFEKELVNRISQKLSSSKTPEKGLLSSLKFHDLNNTGFCDFEQFRSFAGKLGIQSYSSSELKQLFEMYDRERLGRVPHRVLVNRLLGKPDAEPGSVNYNLSQSRLGDDGVSTFSVDPTNAERSFDILLDKLIKLGLPGILRLSNGLRKFDVDLSNHVTLEEFESVLNDLRIQFPPEDVRNMFRYLESSKRLDFMDYSLLIKDLIAGMSESRKGMVRTTYDRLDYSDSTLFDLKQLKPIFNARNYADVKNGRIHAEDIMNEFFACIDLYVDMQRERDSRVNAEQFLEFWEHISPAIDSEATFESLVKSCFRFNELPRKNKLEIPEYGKVVMSPIYDKERYHPSDSMQYTMFPGSRKETDSSAIYSIFEHLREQLSKRGPKGFVLLFRSLKTNDHDHDGRISINEFIKALREVRVGLLDKETLAVFGSFDPSSSGFIRVDEFMHKFIPELNPKRAAVVDELLAALGGASGQVTYSAIKKAFNPRGHPDFLSNVKADYTIKEDFYQVLDTYLRITVGLNEAIPRDVMLSFFELYSYAFVDDNYFENIIRGVFRLTKFGVDLQKSRVAQDFADNQSTYSERPVSSYSQQKSQTGSQYRLNTPFGTDYNAPQQSPSRPKTASHASQYGEQQVAESQRLEQSPPNNGFGKKQQAQHADAHYRGDRSDMDSAYMGMKEDMSVLSSAEKINESPRRTARHPPADFRVTYETSREKIVKQGFLELERQFVLIDTNRTRQCNINQLSNCLGLVGVKISNEELEAVFQRAAKGASDVNYLDVINELRGQMSKHREAGVISLFKDMIETTHSDYVTASQLLKWFRADNHPDIYDRHLSPDKIHEEFADKLDLFGRLGVKSCLPRDTTTRRAF